MEVDRFYGTHEYWERRYSKKRKREKIEGYTNEWYFSWFDMKELVEGYFKRMKNLKILDVGWYIYMYIYIYIHIYIYIKKWNF